MLLAAPTGKKKRACRPQADCDAYYPGISSHLLGCRDARMTGAAAVAPAGAQQQKAAGSRGESECCASLTWLDPGWHLRPNSRKTAWLRNCRSARAPASGCNRLTHAHTHTHTGTHLDSRSPAITIQHKAGQHIPRYRHPLVLRRA